MGRWTNEYQDAVLTSKLKGLVYDAITRAKLEKEPTTSYSYRNFVEDLDAGDSFTAGVIEILVQELAERRSRSSSSPGDRRLIADRTAKSLRMLATPIRVYRERDRNATSSRTLGMSRRHMHMADYLSAPPPPDAMDMAMEMGMDMEEDDEEDFDSLLDRGSGSNVPEGVRVNSELFDAYGSSWTAPSRRPMTVAPTPPLSDDASTPPGLFTVPAPASRMWALPPPAPASTSGPTLSRQPSFRRPARSRALDFNDFTSMRRSTAREAREPRVEADGRTTRRFFPFSVRRNNHELPWAEAGAGNSASAPQLGETVYVAEPEPELTPTTFYTFPTPSASASSASSTPTEERPRLRRGGIRPPESLLFQRDSDDARSETPPEATPAAVVEAASYPTPGDSPASESGHPTQAETE